MLAKKVGVSLTLWGAVGEIRIGRWGDNPMAELSCMVSLNHAEETAIGTSVNPGGVSLEQDVISMDHSAA